MTLSHVNRFKVGQQIRAYEFKPCAGRNDCYHEGVVLETNYAKHGYEAYLINVTRHVFAGESVPESVDQHVIVPHFIGSREYSHRIMAV
jgi:hypothetical protein